MNYHENLFTGIIFQQIIDNKLVTFVINGISYSDFTLKILEPEKYKESLIYSPHIPYFSFPTLLGYVYKDSFLTLKFYDYCRFLIEEFFYKHKIFQKELIFIKNFLSIGSMEDDLCSYLKDKYDVCFNIDDLPYFLKYYILNNTKA